MPYSVGKSSYPDLRGQTQYVATAEIAAQVASLCYEFDTQVAKEGDRLTVNEGIRPRDRQVLMYQNWIHKVPGANLAAYATWGPPARFTSTHDESRGSALDFGIRRADGSNRALTAAEFNWLHARAPQRGIRWTGAGFSRVEPWHHNGGYPASVRPIPGVNLPGEPINAPNSSTPTTPTPEEEEDVPNTVNYVYCDPNDRSNFRNALYAIDAATGNARHVQSYEERAIARGRGLNVADWRAKYAEKLVGIEIQRMLNDAGGEQPTGYLGKTKEIK